MNWCVFPLKHETFHFDFLIFLPNTVNSVNYRKYFLTFSYLNLNLRQITGVFWQLRCHFSISETAFYAFFVPKHENKVLKFSSKETEISKSNCSNHMACYLYFLRLFAKLFLQVLGSELKYVSYVHI